MSASCIVVLTILKFIELVDESSNTYRIKTFLKYAGLDNISRLPATCCLFAAPIIDSPLSRLLVHLSTARRYIDEILQDREEQIIQVDGTTSLGHLVKLRMDGWRDGRVEGW